MREATTDPIESRAAFFDGVERLLRAARQRVVLADPDFESWPLRSPTADDALHTFLLRPGAGLRLLVGDPGWLERHGERLMRTRRQFASTFECRRVPESMRSAATVAAADGQHLLRLPQAGQFRGSLVIGQPAGVDPVWRRLEALWDESEPCLPATTLGL